MKLIRSSCIFLAWGMQALHVTQANLRGDIEHARHLSGFQVKNYLKNSTTVRSGTTTTCPVIPDGVACTMEYEPVTCGSLSCEYSNSCNAEAAGWKINSECKSGTTSSETSTTNTTTTTTRTTCPVPKAGVMCTADFRNTSCGSPPCFYSNPCNAGATGAWKEGDCTVLDDPTPVVATDTCPPTNPTVRCASSPDAYQCGDNNCYYGSECVATTSGWDVDTECDRVALIANGPDYTYNANGCPLTDPSVMCTMEVDPVKCRSNSNSTIACRYSNACQAEGAGWASEECMSLATMPATPPEQCPVGDSNVACTMEYDPKTCSRGIYHKCEYGNPCMARAAGFGVRRNCY
jgi:hypothetical protein